MNKFLKGALFLSMVMGVAQGSVFRENKTMAEFLLNCKSDPNHADFTQMNSEFHDEKFITAVIAGVLEGILLSKEFFALGYLWKTCAIRMC